MEAFWHTSASSRKNQQVFEAGVNSYAGYPVHIRIQKIDSANPESLCYNMVPEAHNAQYYNERLYFRR